MPRLYNNKQEFTTLINCIRDQIYYNIPEKDRPTKDEFIVAFNKNMTTAMFTNLLNKIEDSLCTKSNK